MCTSKATNPPLSVTSHADVFSSKILFCPRSYSFLMQDNVFKLLSAYIFQLLLYYTSECVLLAACVLGHKQQFDSNLAICRIDLISNPEYPQYINSNIYQQFEKFLKNI